MMRGQLGHVVGVGDLQPEVDGFGRFYCFHRLFGEVTYMYQL